MPAGQLSKPRSQDDRGPDQPQHDRNDPAQGQALAQKQRGPDGDIDRRKIVHRRHLGDRDTGHGVEPQDNAHPMQPAAYRKKRPLAARQLRLAQRANRGQQEHQAKAITDKSSFGGRQARAHMFDQSGHANETQAGHDHPEDTGDGALGMCSCHGRNIPQPFPKGKVTSAEVSKQSPTWSARSHHPEFASCAAC